VETLDNAVIAGERQIAIFEQTRYEEPAGGANGSAVA
jgi:hypothetical protein